MIVLDVQIGDGVTITLQRGTFVMGLSLEEAEELLAALPAVVERAKAADRDARLAEIRRLEERLDALRGQVAREAPKPAEMTTVIANLGGCTLPVTASVVDLERLHKHTMAGPDDLAELDETT